MGHPPSLQAAPGLAGEAERWAAIDGLVRVGRACLAKGYQLSVTIHYFFNYAQNLPELVMDVNACLGCALAPYEGNPNDQFTRFLSIELSLRVSEGYENDGELDLESFGYELDFRTSAGEADARPIQLPAIALVIYSLYRQLKITGILVSEMQHLLARYEERNIKGFGIW